MIDVTALILAASVSLAPDALFRNGFDGGECPAGRIVQSDIDYNGTTVPDVNVTAFENIWGRSAPTDPLTFWPGINGATPVIVDFAKNGYVAAGFHVPSDVSQNIVGDFRYSSFPVGPLLDFSISTACGDFSSELGSCVAFDMASDDSALIRWRMSNGTAFWCALQANTDYYVNIRLYDPTHVPQQCATFDTCPVATMNLFGF